jgi:hypothetical protein
VGATVLLHNVGFCDSGEAVHLQPSVTTIKPNGLLLFSGVNYLVPFEFPLSEKLLATLSALEWLHTQMLLLVIRKIFLVPANIV